MKIPKGQIEKVVNLDIESRYALKHLYFDAPNRRLIGSDGHILIRCTVEVEEGDVSGLIPVSVIQFARENEAEKIQVHEHSLFVLDGTGAIIGTFPASQGTFPAIDPLYKATGKAALVFNPEVLLKAVMAMKARQTVWEEEPQTEDTADMTVALYLPANLETESFLLAPLDAGFSFGEDVSMCAIVMPCVPYKVKDGQSEYALPTAEELLQRGGVVEAETKAV